MSTRRVRLTISAGYRTAVSTATVSLSDMFVVNGDTSLDEMIEAMKAVVRAHAIRMGDQVIGDIDVKRFEVEDL